MPLRQKNPIRRRVTTQTSSSRGCRGFPVIVVLFGLAVAPSAHGTTVVDASLESLAKSSDAVVIGRVLRQEVFPEGPSGLAGIHTLVELEVEEYVVGSGPATLGIWVHGGRLGDRWRVVHGQAVFRTGEEVALFLREDPNGNLWPNGMRWGKWVLAEDGVPPVLAPGTGATLTGAGRPEGTQALTRDELRERVRAARQVP